MFSEIAHRRIGQLAVVACLVFLIFVLWYTAWIDEDAFITLRVVDNVWAGLGAGYNPFVRSQAYTHPLWFLLLTAVYPISYDGYLVAIFCSAFCTVLAIFFLYKVQSDTWTFAATVIALCASKAWVDYASSGLENPLAYLLFVLLMWRMQKSQEVSISLLLISSSLILTRPDYAVLVAPVIAWATAVSVVRSKKGPRAIVKIFALGTLPLFVWYSFAFAYYGTIFPNSYYAKVISGYSPKPYDWAMRHFELFWQIDPAGALALMTGSVGALVLLPRYRSLIVGLVLYVSWFISIGGDYQVGRFCAVPILICTVLLALICRNAVTRGVFIAASVLFLALNPRSPISSLYLVNKDLRVSLFNGLSNKGTPFTDERLLVYSVFGFQHAWVENLYLAGFKRGHCEKKKYQLKNTYGAGRNGWVGCREMELVDHIGLVDPFIARMPASIEVFSPGHVVKGVPKGYLESLCVQENRIEDPILKDFYEEVRLISTGPLWSKERFLAALKLLRHPRPSASVPLE